MKKTLTILALGLSLLVSSCASESTPTGSLRADCSTLPGKYKVVIDGKSDEISCPTSKIYKVEVGSHDVTILDMPAGTVALPKKTYDVKEGQVIDIITFSGS